MKQFYLIVMLLFGIVASALAQESIVVKTNKVETGYITGSEYKTTSSKPLHLTFVLTNEVVYVDDASKSRYNLIEKVSEKEEKGQNYSVEYTATDEDDVPCNVRLYTSSNFTAIWILYSNAKIFRYMKY